MAIYQKPSSNECYERRSQDEPPLCQKSDDPNAAWYFFYVNMLFKAFYRDDGQVCATVRLKNFISLL